jgi:hypothetical protein
VKAVDAHTFTKQAEIVQINVCQKADCNYFRDSKRVLMVRLMQKRTTITSDVYCEKLKELRRVIQNERRRMLTNGVVLLHANARPHTVYRTGTLLEHFNWELFDHPIYSPDLSPSDYQMFIYLKNWLRS